jgi:hypothetical protein
VKLSAIHLWGIAIAVLPFACVAVGGGRSEFSNGEGGAETDTTQVGGARSGTASNVASAQGGTAGDSGGATGPTDTEQVPEGPPDPAVGYGVMHASPYPCTSNTAAYYDAPPLIDPTAGCKDVYDATQSYPAGCTRTVVAPTAPQGASCVAIDCWCSAATQRWEPSSSTACFQ